MPLHLQAITNDSQNSSLLAWILQKGMDESNSIFISSDAMYFHIQRNIVDVSSNVMIGRLVYTIKHNEEQQALEILDLDIVLENNNPSKIRFLELREGSSDSNEYYEVETVEGGNHLEIETVNRYTESESILGTERDVFISVFPFELSVYQDIDAFNKWAGISKPIQVGETEWRVGGFSETFCMPGGMFNAKKKDDEHYSFLIGKVKSFRDVTIAFGEFNLPFVLTLVDTALGLVPVAIGKEVFDISNLKEGCIVAMNADVKADLSRPEQFKELGSD